MNNKLLQLPTLGALLTLGCMDGPIAPEATPGRSAVSQTLPPLPFTLSVEDPAGDHTGAIDVVRMVMAFDNISGNYEITLRAAASNPFVGAFRVNINLFDPDAPSFFSDVLNDFNTTVPSTTLTLTGNSPVLTSWSVGDRVYPNSLDGTPNPPGVSLYRSSVTNFPIGFLTNEDFIAFAETARPAVIKTVLPVTFDPAPVVGEVKVCTFQTQAAFTASATGPGHLLSEAFDLPLSGCSVIWQAAPGQTQDASLTVAELVPAGWELGRVHIRETPGGATRRIPVPAGDQVTVTANGTSGLALWFKNRLPDDGG